MKASRKSYARMPLGILEQCLYTTTRIVTMAGGQTMSGTGFFLNYIDTDNQVLPLIVTNKHVIAGATTGSFCLHESTPGGEPSPNGTFMNFTIPDFEKLWIGHPDTNIDIAVMSSGPVFEHARQNGKRAFLVQFDNSLIADEPLLQEIGPGEEILMIGYPNGLWDTKNNLPLFRRGIIASHPAMGFCGKSEFLIDAACFPGSSGSPVMVANVGSYIDKNGNVFMKNRFALLGMLWGGPQMLSEGEIIASPIPTAVVPISQTPTMIHLGFVIPAREVLVCRKTRCVSACASQIGRPLSSLPPRKSVPFVRRVLDLPI